MDRKELLLEEADSTRDISRVDEQRLRKAVDDGGAYLALVSSPGWKKLVEEYINKEISQDRYLTAPVNELADIRAAQRALINLLRFVSLKVEEGQKSFDMLRGLSANKEDTHVNY